MHRLGCKPFTNLPSRPSNQHVLCLVLHDQEPTPRFEWINISNMDQSVQEKMADEEHELDCIQIGQYAKKYFIRDRCIEGFLKLNSRDNFLNDGSTQNMCTPRINHRPVCLDWKGPLVVVRAESNFEASGRYADITLQHLRHVADFSQPTTLDQKVPGIGSGQMPSATWTPSR